MSRCSQSGQDEAIWCSITLALIQSVLAHSCTQGARAKASFWLCILSISDLSQHQNKKWRYESRSRLHQLLNEHDKSLIGSSWATQKCKETKKFYFFFLSLFETRIKWVCELYRFSHRPRLHFCSPMSWTRSRHLEEGMKLWNGLIWGLLHWETTPNLCKLSKPSLSLKKTTCFLAQVWNTHDMSPTQHQGNMLQINGLQHWHQEHQTCALGKREGWFWFILVVLQRQPYLVASDF